MTTDLVTMEEARFLPALTLPQAIARRDAMVEFVQQIMKPGVDFGVVPGTSTKPTLLKPGAERLCSFFGLTPDFELVSSQEQWDADEPLFYYRYKCRLLRDGRVIGDGEGSCNSRESKYRWRDSKRVCPDCGVAAIIRGKEEFGGGWLCFKKQGGCGAKYSAGDQAIEGQPIGRVPNPDIFDLVNTIQKMAQKRSFICSVLIAVNASEYFSQDLEDLHLIGTPAPATDPVLLDILRAELAAARDRLRIIGGEPRPLTKKQVDTMDARALADEIGQTTNAAWTLAKSKLTEKQASPARDESLNELFDEVEAEAAK